MNAVLSIVVPVYNEENNISNFLKRSILLIEKITNEYEVIFCLDPSSDRSEEVILRERERNDRIKLILFSRRFGQPMAIMAGLQYSRGEAVIVIDVDLQDPPELIPEMVAKWREGYDVVIPQRRKRNGETWSRTLLAELGYKIINKIAEVSIPQNGGDFRLISRRAVDEIVRLKECHGFLRVMVALVGFKQCLIPFDRPGRQVGTTKYNLYTGSLRVGFNGLFCFSTYALTLSTKIGFIIAGLSFMLAFIYIALKLSGFPFPLGNPSLAILILFLGGIQLVSVGILGEYIGRIYEEVRERPKFIIDKTIGLSKL